LDGNGLGPSLVAGAFIDWLAARLLGAHVGGGAEQHAGASGFQRERWRVDGRGNGARGGLGFERFGKSEIEDLYLAFRSQLDVRPASDRDARFTFCARRPAHGDLARDGPRFGNRNRTCADE
jgi:hypothetical protein